jgi:hypothetical protein
MVKAWKKEFAGLDLRLEKAEDILNCDTISVFYNNTVSPNIEQLSKKYDPIIKTGSISFAIEDMIDIEEQESEPMGIPIPEPTTRSIPITPIEPSKVTVQKEEQKDEQKDDVKPDAFADFMNKIPMKSETTAKRSPKNTQAKIKASEQPLKSGITLESVINTVLTNNVANAVIKPENQGSSGKEELKPIGKYNLGELQHLAKVYKINTQKDGKAGKMINKTKEELYNEIKEKQ